MGMDPLHYEAEPVSIRAGGSFRIRTVIWWGAWDT